MLTIILTGPEQVLLLDALEAYLEASPIRTDPDTILAEQLMTRLRDTSDAIDNPAH